MRVTENYNANIISDKETRDKCANHYEVLEKVKTLLLIPGTEFATITEIADFYEVSVDPIQKIYQRNKSEIDMDGIQLISANELIGHDCPISKEVSKNQFKTIISYENGRILEIPNRGIKVFPKRAILRIGMILQNSKVASEIREQLLNILDKVSDEVKTYDINEEQSLMLAVGMAVASGDANAVAVATTNLIAFKNRHIEKLKVDNAKLENDNKALAGNILEWSDRKSMSAGIRMLKSVTSQSYSDLWNELYRNLQYKYGICLKQRGKSPFIQHVKEDEWGKVLKTFSAMCEAYGQSPTDMIKRTVMSN